MLFTYGLSFVTALLCPALHCWGWLSANYIFQAPLLHAFQPGSALVGAQKSRGRDFCLWHQLHGKDWQLLVDSGAGRRRLKVSGRASRRLTRPGKSGTSLAVPAPSHVAFLLAAVAPRQQVRAGGCQAREQRRPGHQISPFFLFSSSNPAQTFVVNSFCLKYIVYFVFLTGF